MSSIGKGSEWKKWDLHFHTPSSHDYGDKSVTNEEIIEILNQENISVVAITDHHVIDVKRIQQLQILGRVHGITILPGIEFLSDARGKDPIHFIGIFPENANLEFIWGQLENKTGISKIKGEGKRPDEVYCDLVDTIELVKTLGGIDSLKFVESELQYLNEKLTNDLLDIREKRILATIEIFEKKQEIKKFYDEIKFEIDSRFNSAKVSGLNIVSSLAVKNDFEDELLKNIQQNKSGSFYGKDEGRNLLRNEIISNVNWNEKSNVEKFLREIICYLEFDKRPMNIEPYERTFIDNLVKNRKDFYSYLFSLEYLQSHYDLQQNGKSLEQLSPGEKGALLLVFYLILDKEDIPLIIDQPEDNLDNYSVAQILVPYIKEAKRKRQIIIVTHNPNLAVVSDSEQVIRVSIDKNDGNRFCCVSGGIDEKNINNAVVEVLEGTIPAFKTRKDKYFGNS
ncbi:AAA family ATPase [Undibacterium sp. Ji22W]|uniref:AAA family ATPase n=1 Tax=Undibacterium sp. Ji22W TaxID=3413038 RepID=UPI003BF3D285